MTRYAPRTETVDAYHFNDDRPEDIVREVLPDLTSYEVRYLDHEGGPASNRLANRVELTLRFINAEVITLQHDDYLVRRAGKWHAHNGHDFRQRWEPAPPRLVPDGVLGHAGTTHLAPAYTSVRACSPEDMLKGT